MTIPSPAESGPAENGPTIMRLVDSVRGLFLRLIETGYVFVAFIVLIYILLGADSGVYVLSVVSNLTSLIALIGPQSLVGIAIVLALVHLARRHG